MKKYSATMVILNNQETVGLLPALMKDLVEKLIPSRFGETVLPWTIKIEGTPFPEVDGIKFRGTIMTEERMLNQEEMAALMLETVAYCSGVDPSGGEPGNDAG